MLKEGVISTKDHKAIAKRIKRGKLLENIFDKLLKELFYVKPVSLLRFNDAFLEQNGNSLYVDLPSSLSTHAFDPNDLKLIHSLLKDAISGL